MKRSDMLKQIKSIIATCGPTQPTVETAEQVLKACEDAGMVPPHTKVINCNCYDHNWEPENE